VCNKIDLYAVTQHDFLLVWCAQPITPHKKTRHYEYIQSNIRMKLQGLPRGRKYIRSHWRIIGLSCDAGYSKRLRTLEIILFGYVITIQFALDVESIKTILRGDE